ncbi:TadE/TadG family type IV pilus assembly protein [Pseudodesulfovibrio tunisiensis]|uniref:TadE/TadG family type IV pilus assembly protein n=1 Tax=Pseudodesulfovibrio tunisiensis TaxID=463192 RepID=UPI001FB2162E|nr:TadE/TadG family type IV pilus assembly protein [Pseudodesulfovibrio tunisiensis]
MRNDRRNTRSRSGQAVVETALILPLFVVVLLGIMDFARLYWTQSVVRGAANEGARMAILVEAEENDILDRVIGEIASGGLDQTPNVSVGERNSGQPVSVSVSVPFEFVVVGSIVPGLESVNQVAATAVMTRER